MLAFGDVIRERYVSRGWARRAWTWHEAADTTRFRPPAAPDACAQPDGDLVWVGNWGDDERSAEIRSYLIDPVRELSLRARIHGVGYPDEAVRELTDAGIEYGWLPNYLVPEGFGRFAMMVHVPRRPYVTALFRARHTCAHRVNELFGIRGVIQRSLTEKAFTV